MLAFVSGSSMEDKPPEQHTVLQAARERQRRLREQQTPPAVDALVHTSTPASPPLAASSQSSSSLTASLSTSTPSTAPDAASAPLIVHVRPAAPSEPVLTPSETVRLRLQDVIQRLQNLLLEPIQRSTTALTSLADHINKLEPLTYELPP